MRKKLIKKMSCFLNRDLSTIFDGVFLTKHSSFPREEPIIAVLQCPKYASAQSFFPTKAFRTQNFCLFFDIICIPNLL